MKDILDDAVLGPCAAARLQPCTSQAPYLRLLLVLHATRGQQRRPRLL